MNIIDPRIREAVIIDGVRFTIRPLTGGDIIYLQSLKRGEWVTAAATRGVTAIDGAPFPDMTVDQFPADVICKITERIQRLSGLTETDEKNSKSRPESLPETAATSTACEHTAQAAAVPIA